MRELLMKKKILLKGSIEDESRDFREIIRMKKAANEVAILAGRYNERKFDNADNLSTEEEYNLIVEIANEDLLKDAQELVNISEELEKKAREFYRRIGFSIKGPAEIEGKASVIKH